MRRLGMVAVASAVLCGSAWASSHKNVKTHTPAERYAMSQERARQAGFHVQDLHAWISKTCDTKDRDDLQDCQYEYREVQRNAAEMQEEIHTMVKLIQQDYDLMADANCETPSASCSKDALHAYERIKSRARIVELNSRLIEDYHVLASEMNYRVGSGRFGGTYDSVADIVKNLRFIQVQVKSDYRTSVEPFKSELEKYIVATEK